MQRLQLLESLTNDPSSKAPKEAMDALGQLANAIQQGLHQEWRSSQMPVIHALLPSSCRSSSFGNAGRVSSIYSFGSFRYLFLLICWVL